MTVADVDEAFDREWGDWRKDRPLSERDWVKGWFKRGWDARDQEPTGSESATL